MIFFRRLFSFSTVLFALIAASGCRSHQTPPAPLPSPTTLFSKTYFLGSPLSGPVPGIFAVANPADSMSINVSFIALEKLPENSFKPVGSTADFFSSIGGGYAVLPVAELTSGSTFKDLSPSEDLTTELKQSRARRMTSMAAFTGALPPGVTADFKALDPVSIDDPITALPTRRTLEIMVSRPEKAGSGYQIALVLKDLVKQKDADSVIRTETAIFNRPDDHPNTALVVPFRFDDAQAKAVAIQIQISPGGNNPDHIAATIDCLKQISAQLATTQPALASGEASSQSTLIAALQSLTPIDGRRSALAFLTDQTGASLCEDVAMEADDSVLEQLVHDIQAVASENKSIDPNPKAIGWLLDHTALKLLAKISNDAANGTGKFPRELTAILTIHTGEVGRHSSSLDDVLRGLTSRDELDNRLLAENTIYLEDSSPASRVRAYDWLNARHQAPAGYDPLGDAKSRRDALDRSAGTP